MQNENSTEWPSEKKYGICQLPLIGVYLEPRHGSGLMTQLLFGETYEVISSSKDLKWMKIFRPSLNLTGWIFSVQYESLSLDDYTNYQVDDFKITTSPITTIQFKGNSMYLLPGSELRIGNNELFDLEKTISLQGETRDFIKKASREELMEIADIFVNAPYLSGGRSLYGVGTGSFIQLVYKIGGYRLPKFISQLIDLGKSKSIEAGLPGDLIIFSNEKGIPHHVGLISGKDEIIHVRGKVMREKVQFSKIGGKQNNSLLHQVFEIRRLIEV
ncbi:C40 family peptidase [Pararhodonellum marinum]|uniref:C40 family peptidase n=1 Tax=Pararhodonellum marinum TaxID=2755358 RepID=UPI0018905A08|nr:NlpC/P60 family protein [Pararhodonellum marinum]